MIAVQIQSRLGNTGVDTLNVRVRRGDGNIPTAGYITVKWNAHDARCRLYKPDRGCARPVEVVTTRDGTKDHALRHRVQRCHIIGCAVASIREPHCVGQCVSRLDIRRWADTLRRCDDRFNDRERISGWSQIHRRTGHVQVAGADAVRLHHRPRIAGHIRHMRVECDRGIISALDRVSKVEGQHNRHTAIICAKCRDRRSGESAEHHTAVVDQTCRQGIRHHQAAQRAQYIRPAHRDRIGDRISDRPLCNPAIALA